MWLEPVRDKSVLPKLRWAYVTNGTRGANSARHFKGPQAGSRLADKAADKELA